MKAAFFVLGVEVEKRPRGLVDIMDERQGHVVGNHSYDHIGSPGTTTKLLATKEGKARVLWQYEKTHDIVSKYRQMQHWRAPRLEGIQSTWELIRNSPKLKSYLSHCDSHADSGDSLGAKTAETMLNNLLSSKENFGLFQPRWKNRGNLRLLFHVKDSTASALPKVLEGLQRAGQRIVDFSQES